MARIAHPWYWEERNGWYVNRNGQRQFLGTHPTNAPAPKKSKGKWNAPEAIRTAFHTLMGSAPPPVIPVVTGLTLALLFDKYLEWCHGQREKRTYDGYVWHLQKFCDHLKATGKDPKAFPALSLRPFHVNEYLDANPDWGKTYRRNAIASVKRAFTWGEEEGHIEVTPLKKLKKPGAERREHVITPADWVKIRDSYKEGDPFREFLTFCWETGCRPFEARRLEGRHVNLEKKLIAIPPKEAKGRKRWRVIRLEGLALEIVRQHQKEGVLFTNRDGKPWTTYSINCRFCRLEEKIGVKHFAYAFRHSYAQRLLVSGVDHLTVAELLGHVDGTTLAKTYQHLDQADDHLRKVLREAGTPAA